MENEKVNQLIEKIMEGEGKVIAPRGDVNDKIDARQQPYREPETPLNYRDWLKKQPKPTTIGYHKTKKPTNEDSNLQEKHPMHRRRAITKRIGILKQRMGECTKSNDPQSCKEKYNSKISSLQDTLNRLSNLRF